MPKFKTFIVNLERDTLRKSSVELQLKKENIENYEFVKAVDGQNGDLEHFNFKVIPDWVEPFTSKIMTKGEIGCALSHYRIWEKIVEEKLDYTLILEDDIILCENFVEKVREVFISIKDLNVDLLYLGRRPRNPDSEIKIDRNIVKAKYSYGMHGYLLTYDGAKKLLESNYLNNLFPLDEFIPLLYDDNYPLSQYLKYFENRPVFNAYSVDPLLIDIVFGEHYKSTTYNTDPYTILENIDEYLVVSVGTENNDALKRFENSCQIYGHPYKILGLNTCWNGGDMAKGPGGGQKVNLLKNELLTWSTEELNKIIIFTDSYDVVVIANKNEIFEKYNKLCGDNDNTIVFSSELSCWPDKELANWYPDSPTKMKYLNSGGFMGKASDILKILDKEIQNYEDDQYYYTIAFFSQGNYNIKIVLDYYCEIFQTLNGCTKDIDIVFYNSRVKNNNYGSSPCIIHGNGNENIKLYLNSISNYLAGGWNSTYKFCLNSVINNTPKIYICCQSALNVNEVLDYPLEQCIIRSLALEDVVDEFLKTDAEYLFVIEKKYHISNPDTLKELLNINKSVVGPMVKKNGNEFWSNFWGELSDSGYYVRSFDYFDIISYRRKAIWNIPYLTGIYLIKREVLEKFPNVYKDNSNLDLDMRFCKNLRKTNTFMYVTNLNKYGYIDDSEITIYDVDNSNWEKKYIHPEYIKNMANLASICDEPCKDLFFFPIFSQLFCSELIQCCDDLNQWSDGKNDKVDPRINTYENVPTQDIHLKQINFEQQWEKIVFKYIAPVASKMYSFYKTKNINISFVVKYSMEGQKNLVQHHDSSTYTINVCLNDAFEGGGCRFVRQDFVLNNKNIGYASMHPGRLTHYHEGLYITSGKRYILVSFIN
jgi:GR25 family glycosyltransferase involved in LPS biosynthesis